MRFDIFQKPFPYSNNFKEKITLTCIVSMSVFFLLLVFQPFGLGSYAFTTLIPIILGYAVLCFIIVLFNLAFLAKLFPTLFEEKNWKVYKQVLWSCYNIITVGFVNYIYSYALNIFPFSLAGLIQMLVITFLVAVFPVALMTIFRYNYLLNKHLQHLTEFNLQLQKYHHQLVATPHLPPPITSIITLKSEEKNGNLALNLEQLLYIEANDNYIEVCYFKEAKLQKTLLRNTLKNIETDLQGYSEIFRCHRSYLVNLQQVHSIIGNSQGYRLEFEQTDFQIPVSRSLAKALKERIENKN